MIGLRSWWAARSRREDGFPGTRDLHGYQATGWRVASDGRGHVTVVKATGC